MRRLVVALMLAALPSLASAACFDDIGREGCTDSENFPKADLRGLSCENLWLVRNTIYNEHGFCFKTADGKAQFDNSDCTVRDAAKVRFNRFEQTNITRISQVEAEMGCRR